MLSHYIIILISLLFHQFSRIKICSFFSIFYFNLRHLQANFYCVYMELGITGSILMFSAKSYLLSTDTLKVFYLINNCHLKVYLIIMFRLEQ